MEADRSDSLAMLIEEEREAREEYQQTSAGFDRLYRRASHARWRLMLEVLDGLRAGDLTVGEAAALIYGEDLGTNAEALATEIGGIVRYWISDLGRQQREAQ